MPSREARSYLRQKLEKKRKEACIDCGEQGHPNKYHFSCSEFVKSTKRKRQSGKDDYETKVAKSKGKKKRLQELKESKDPSVPTQCPSCQQIGHANAASKLCPYHIWSKDERLKHYLGNDYEVYARKVYLKGDSRTDDHHGVIKETFNDHFINRTVEMTAFIRQVIFRAQLFVNSTVINNADLPVQPQLCDGNFWYSMCQLIMEKNITNKNYVNHYVALAFDDIRRQHPSILYPLSHHQLKGYGDPLAAACKTVATTYLNHLVENLEKRLKYYLYLNIRKIYEDPSKGKIYELITDYCLPKLVEGSSKVPSGFDIVSNDHLSRVDELCASLAAALPSLPNTENIAASPTSFIPVLRMILSYIETECEACTDQEKMPKLFSLVPLPSYHWRHITINDKAIACLSRQSYQRSYTGGLTMFFEVFDFTKFGYESLEDLKLAPDNNKDMFMNVVHTDGFGISFLFARKKAPATASCMLSLEDFTMQEVNKYFVPVAVDPGRKHIFTAAVGFDNAAHEVRRCSMKERREYVGSRRRNEYVQGLKRARNIEEIETNIPTAKTALTAKLHTHIAYVLPHLNTLLNFYGPQSAKFRFHNYQGRQRSNDELANILVDGGKKYNKARRKKTSKNKKRKRRKKKKEQRKQKKQKDSQVPTVVAKGKKKAVKWKPKPYNSRPLPVPLIAYGDGMKSKDTVKMKGHLPGVTGMVYKKIKQRQSCHLAAIVDIDEYKTSKVCSKCLTINLEKVEVEVDGNTVELHSTLSCKTCGVLWNRDINASKNMLQISLSTWRGYGRPEVYQRNRRSEDGAVGLDQTA